MERLTAVGLCCICMVFGGAVSLARFGCNNLVISTFDERKLAPQPTETVGNVSFPWFLMKSEPSTVYLWDTGSGIAGAQWCFCMLPAWEHFFLQNFSVQKWNLPRYFMGKRGDKKMVNLQTSASPYLAVLVSWNLARPEFIQTSVESIDSKVVSKCLTLPEKSGGPKGERKISMGADGDKQLPNIKNDDVHIWILPKKVVTFNILTLCDLQEFWN